MEINGSAGWADLETRGFVHIRNFLSSDEIAACRADYEARPVDTTSYYFVLSVASEQGVDAVRHRIQEVLTAVGAHTSLKVDHILCGLYFAAKGGTFFPWHQDHDNFTNPNHFDQLNFYIPVVKPLRYKSNLCIVPFDALERESPKTFRRTVRHGASTTYDLGGRQLVFQDETGATHLVKANLDDLACTPQLEAGDLLLLRNDVFHRTEDNDTARVALSVRATNGKTLVRRAQLANGGVAKAARMARNYTHYEAMFRAFDEAGRDELSLSELLTAAARFEGSRGPDSGRFRNVLLKEKIRNGVLASSVRIALSETLVRPIVARYHWHQLQSARSHPASGSPVRTT